MELLVGGNGVAVVVGGGLIGIKLTEVLLQLGVETRYIIWDKHYFPQAFSDLEAEMLTQHMGSHSCGVHLGTEATEIDQISDSFSRLQLNRMENRLK